MPQNPRKLVPNKK